MVLTPKNIGRPGKLGLEIDPETKRQMEAAAKELGLDKESELIIPKEKTTTNPDAIKDKNLHKIAKGNDVMLNIPNPRQSIDKTKGIPPIQI